MTNSGLSSPGIDPETSHMPGNSFYCFNTGSYCKFPGILSLLITITQTEIEDWGSMPGSGGFK